MTTHTDDNRGYSIVHPDTVDDAYAGSDVPGEFRRLGDALGAGQLAVTLIRVLPRSDFEQGTGHVHEEIEELYLVTKGTLTMRFGNDIHTVQAPAAVRVAPSTGGAPDSILRGRPAVRRVLTGLRQRRAAASVRGPR
jgi:uncharacterized cupin superfamily protein